MDIKEAQQAIEQLVDEHTRDNIRDELSIILARMRAYYLRMGSEDTRSRMQSRPGFGDMGG